jgi:hypothetical protein
MPASDSCGRQTAKASEEIARMARSYRWSHQPKRSSRTWWFDLCAAELGGYREICPSMYSMRVFSSSKYGVQIFLAYCM